MLSKLRHFIDLSVDHFKKILENIKMRQTKKNSDIKSNLEAINGQVNDTEQLSNLEDRILEITQ